MPNWFIYEHEEQEMRPPKSVYPQALLRMTADSDAEQRCDARARIVILEGAVQPVRVQCELLLSYQPLSEGALDPESQIDHVLVPWGSQFPGNLRFTGNWLPLCRDHSPVAHNTCEEDLGMTIWHHIALGGYPFSMIEEFLATAAGVGEVQLRRDLWEFSGAKPDIRICSGFGPGQPGYVLRMLERLPYEDQHRILRYRTPLELSVLGGLPFLRPYIEKLRIKKNLHPAIQELMHWSGMFHLRTHRDFIAHAVDWPF